MGKKRKNFWLIFTGLVVAAAVGASTQPEVSSGIKSSIPLVFEMTEGLSEKEKTFKDREARLTEWEDRLKVEEDRIKGKLEELQTLQAEITKKQDEELQKKKAIEAKLTKTVEKMDPKKRLK